jgi:hypothetical protein
MELIHHICERDISNSKIEEQFRFENLAPKQKTFRIVKEQHDVIRTSCDHYKLSSTDISVDTQQITSSHRTFVRIKRQGWWSQPGSNR